MQEEETNAATAERPAPAPGVVTAALAGVGARLAGRYDRVDRTCLLGLLLLGAGLWLWFSLGVALTVGGGLVLALGVLGALAQAPAQPAGPATGSPRGS